MKPCRHHHTPGPCPGLGVLATPSATMTTPWPSRSFFRPYPSRPSILPAVVGFERPPASSLPAPARAASYSRFALVTSGACFQVPTKPPDLEEARVVNVKLPDPSGRRGVNVAQCDRWGPGSTAWSPMQVYRLQRVVQGSRTSSPCPAPVRERLTFPSWPPTRPMLLLCCYCCGLAAFRHSFFTS